MDFKKTTLVTLAILSIVGCTANEELKSPASKEFSQVDIDLIVQRAKAEERARIAKELDRQEQQKKVFDDILISRGEAPRFSRYYQNKALQAQKKTAQANASAKKPNQPKLDNKTELNQEPNEDSTNALVTFIAAEPGSELTKNRVIDGEGGISKIVPPSRGSRLYRNINGQNYYYCAANSVVPVFGNQGQVSYQAKQTELSATLCKKSRDKKSMLALQKTLYKLGYLKSDSLSYEQLVDGVWGETTLEAVKQYQMDHGLLFGQMTIQTLEHIGVFSTPQWQDMPNNKLDNEFANTQLAKAKIAEPTLPTSTKAIKSQEPEANIKQTDVAIPLEVKAELAENKPEVSVIETKEVTQVAQAAQTAKATATKPKVIEEAKASDQASDQAEPVTNKVPAYLVTLQKDGKTAIRKIMPTSRETNFYQEVGGARYYRCAANSMMPIKTEGNLTYSNQNQELSATLCKMSRDAATMTDLQYELYELGFMPADGMPIGRLISGQWDQRTLQAVKRYQKAHELLYGQLTIETLEHLGIFKPHPSRVLAVADIEQKTVSPSMLAEVNEKTPAIKNELLPQAMVTEVQAKDAQVDDVKAEVVEAKEIQGKEVQILEDQTAEIPFESLRVRLANAEFDAANDVPQTSKPQVYAYVNKFKLFRCRARSILPEVDVAGNLVYSDKKEFRATLCKTNRNKKLITRLQTALRDQGFLKPLPPIDRVVVDGIWGINTLTALKEYQKTYGLAYGQLTIESLEHLSVFVPE